MVEITYQMALNTIQTVSLVVGIIYYITIMRNQQRTRETALKLQEEAEKSRQREMIFLRFQGFDKTYHEAIADVMSQDWGNTIEDWYSHSPESRAQFDYIQVRYNNLGVMLQQKMMDPDLFFQIFPIGNILRFWEKMEDIILDYRETTKDVTYNEGFEYLYNEIKKRFPDISKRGKN
jgi:hypothetical protein